MAVGVIGHLHRAVAEHALDLLRRESLLDEPRCEEMAQRVEAVLGIPDRLAVFVLLPCVHSDAALDLERIEAPIADVGVALGVAVAVREHEIEDAGIVLALSPL